jgi:hypothetical protein
MSCFRSHIQMRRALDLAAPSQAEHGGEVPVAR